MLSYFSIKRVFDCVLSFFLVLLLSPVLAFVSVLIYFDLGSPVLFCQQRPGFLGRPFYMYKFRTMNNTLDPYGRFLPDSDRLTPFGRLLRSTSLDELPELFNILRGEMSFVGPRPLLMQYLPLYSTVQMRRHDVLPGFSGWAQINGRNSISWDEKFRLDLWYVDHQNFWLDFRILFVTVLKVLRRDGISAKGQATMAPFTGSTSSFEAH